VTDLSCTRAEREYLDALGSGRYPDLKKLEAQIQRERIGLRTEEIGRLQAAIDAFAVAQTELQAARAAVLGDASGIPAAEALRDLEDGLRKRRRTGEAPA
jgi:hypothetical protein